jgi:hypothetical protein
VVALFVLRRLDKTLRLGACINAVANQQNQSSSVPNAMQASGAPLKSWTFARFALSQAACRSHSSRCLSGRPWLSVYLGEHGCPGAAAANAALCRISAREQLNLFGHALFFLEAGIVAGDALCEHEIPISRLEHVQRHLLSRSSKKKLRESSQSSAVSKACTMCHLRKGAL